MTKSIAKSFSNAFMLVLLCSSAMQAQQGSAPQDAKPGVPTSTTSTQTPAAGSGVVTDSVYRNEYFGLRIALPQGWTVQGDDVKQRIHEGGKKAIVTTNEEDKKQLEAAVDRTLNLLTASKFPLGTPGEFNALFMAVAEAVPLSATGPAYMKQLKSVLQQTRVPATVPDDYETETINGVQFYTLTITLRPGEQVVRQKYYVVLMKGYALGLISSIISESDTETVNSILKSVTIQKM